jgi:hypothetical protein
MATNFYFQSGIPMGKRSESLLHEDLIIECLKIYGFDCFYIPRVAVSRDMILNEDPLNKYEDAFPLEAYLENTTGFGGQQLLSKFGLEIQDTATFIIARRRWEEAVGRKKVAVLERPAEGDLIFFPLTKSFFEIRYVEGKDPFYQVGKLYVYKLECELFQYSHENIQTEVREIDEIIDTKEQNLESFELSYEDSGTLVYENSDSSLVYENFNIKTNDPIAQNNDFDTNISDILDFTEKNPFGEVFTNNAN